MYEYCALYANMYYDVYGVQCMCTCMICSMIAVYNHFFLFQYKNAQ